MRIINIFAVDNVLQKIADPIFIGATIASKRQCGAKAVKKANPHERVGVLCLKDGKPLFDNCLPLEVVREDEFAPIKNADGDDSIITARQLLIKKGYAL